MVPCRPKAVYCCAGQITNAQGFGVTLAGHIRSIFAILALLICLPTSAGLAQTGLAGQARALSEGTVLLASRDGLALDLALSQPVPYRLRLLSAPPRLVVDFNTVIWDDIDLEAQAQGQGLTGLRLGHLPDGWARLVIDLGGPFVISSSDQRVQAVSGQAMISLRLHRVTLEAFEQAAWEEAQFVARGSDKMLHPQSRGAEAIPVLRKPLVMLDPGHGGIDPGAERDGLREADLVLAFARQLREILLRRGIFDVAMTRDADEFVSLDGRIRAARAASADLFVSVHADALPEGMASGTVMYLLGDAASDDSAAYLAERHDRADMLAGIDLSGATDEIARVLMSVAWQDTQPRARALAEALVEGVADAGLRLHRRPIQSGAFTVLRAVDMPSVLMELGFMSNPRDLANLRDPEWMERMAEALADALELWHLRDQAQAPLRRR
jgi:N-acetylmuramoyl-L-alanine amidase